MWLGPGRYSSCSKSSFPLKQLTLLGTPIGESPIIAHGGGGQFPVVMTTHCARREAIDQYVGRRTVLFTERSWLHEWTVA